MTKSDRKGERGLLYPAAGKLWKLQESLQKKFPYLDRRAADSREILMELYGESRGKERYYQFGIEKNRKLLFLLLVGMGLAGLMTVITALDAKNARIDTLKRPNIGEGSASYELRAQADGLRIDGITLQVPERMLTAEEKRELLEKAEAEFEAELMQRGIRLDAVTEDVAFPSSLCNGLVEVGIESSDYDLMDSAGHIMSAMPAEEGEMLQITAVLSCMEEQKLLVFPVRILPGEQDAASRLKRKALRYIEEENEKETDVVVLPDEFDGKKLSWQLIKPSYGGLFAALTIAGCFVLNLAFDRDLEKEREKRKEELQMVYPAFLSRLILLVSTGMPVRRAFLRMAEETKKEDAAFVYEEVLRTCREMEGGKTELQAYENFGKRCRLPQYRKCASLLVQNVKKGSGGLLISLNQEAVNAFEERKALARKKGEEAQTRLLIPMLMMLVVVMLLIMVPAWFSLEGM